RKLKKGKLANNKIVVTDPMQISAYAFNKAKQLMTEDEKKMTYSEWVAYCEQTEKTKNEYYDQTNSERLNELASTEGTAPNLIQSLSLSGMGIYNCDQIQRVNNPVE